MTLQLEVGKTYRTHDNRKVVIIYKMLTTQLDPFVGVLTDNDGTEEIRRWGPDGASLRAPRQICADIVREATPYDDFKVSDPIMVRDTDNEQWERRYFSHAGDFGGVYAFAQGATPWSCKTLPAGALWLTRWSQARRPTPEELSTPR